MADVDRGAIALQRQLDDADGAVDAGAEAARRRDVAEAMLAALNRPYVLDGQTRQTSASMISVKVP